jgi:hypothetical protein
MLDVQPDLLPVARSTSAAVSFLRNDSSIGRAAWEHSTLTSLRYDGYLLRTIPKNNIASN